MLYIVTLPSNHPKKRQRYCKQNTPPNNLPFLQANTSMIRWGKPTEPQIKKNQGPQITSILTGGKDDQPPPQPSYTCNTTWSHRPYGGEDYH